MDRPVDVSTAVVGRIGRTFALAATEAKVAPQLLAAGLVLRVAATDGDACTMVLGPDAVTAVDGAGDRAPDVILEASTATLARVWSGELDVATAIGRREVTASGPVDEILRLLVILPQTYALYRRLVRADADAQAEGGALPATA